MISISAILAMISTLLIGIVLPTLVCVVFCVKKKISMRMVLMGMGAVALSRIILETGLLNPTYNLLEMAFDSESLIASAIVGGVTVALFAEGARYVFARFALDKTLKIKAIDALAFGAGFGLMGNILSMGTSAVGNITLALSINSGTGVFQDYAATVGQETAAQILDSFAAIPAMQFAAGGIQCLMMLAIEIALSMAMIYFIRKRKNLLIIGIFAVHALLNFGTTLMSPHGVWAGEGYIALFAIAICMACYEPIKNYFALAEDLPETQPQQEGAKGEENAAEEEIKHAISEQDSNYTEV